ncbi:MAG: hypothetical protein ABFC71_09740 [Methanoregula sp.]
MKGEFNEIVGKFPGWLDRLQKSPSFSRDQLQNVPDQGIYVFYSEKDQPLYVGRSDRMKTRLLEHSRPSSGHTSATFAFILAKEIWDKSHPNDTRTRREQESDIDFLSLYTKKKNEVATMQVRVIGITDPVEQALFEIYASLELETPYNVWDNH